MIEPLLRLLGFSKSTDAVAAAATTTTETAADEQNTAAAVQQDTLPDMSMNTGEAVLQDTLADETQANDAAAPPAPAAAAEVQVCKKYTALMLFFFTLIMFSFCISGQADVGCAGLQHRPVPADCDLHAGNQR